MKPQETKATAGGTTVELNIKCEFNFYIVMYLSHGCMCIFEQATTCGQRTLLLIKKASLLSYRSIKLKMSLYEPMFALPQAANLT